MNVSRGLGLTGLWLAATVTAVAVATAGVNFVASQVTTPVPVFLPADAVGEAQAAPDLRPLSPTTSPTSEPTSSSTEPATTGEASRGDADDESDTAGQPPATSSPPTSPAPSSSPSPSPAPSSADPSETEDDSRGVGPPTAPETRTVSTTGGRASFRFENGGVELLWATPNDGFQARVIERRETRITLEFTSASHTSTIEARWTGNGARIETDEDEED